jgi:hypothetical protein
MLQNNGRKQRMKMAKRSLWNNAKNFSIFAMAEAAATEATGQSQMCWQRRGNQMEELGEEPQTSDWG